MATMLSRNETWSLPAVRVHALLWLGVCLAAACSDGGPMGPAGDIAGGGPAPGSQPLAGNPFAGATLYAEPAGPASSTAATWRSTRPADAALLDRIGRTPQAAWFNGWHADIATATSSYVGAAAAAGAFPVLVAYNVPQRDCGSYSAGGAGSAEGYLSWVRAFANGIGARRAAVILEPDALAGMDCLSATDRARRTSVLRQAVDILKQNPATFVYLDAGHARWIGASDMAERLREANIARADGFALNVSNYQWNADNVAYGQAIAGLTGGKHFVIDTSRNGQGPASSNEWCNPAGRGLGVSPTAHTGHPLVDALLWIKRPGESDGSCNGGPGAGEWWPDYAVGLAQRASTMLALN